MSAERAFEDAVANQENLLRAGSFVIVRKRADLFQVGRIVGHIQQRRAVDFEQAIKARYSYRKFQEREVPRDTNEKILAISQHTASWNNI